MTDKAVEQEICTAYRFCPLCSAPRQSVTPARPFKCDQCGYMMFFGPVAAVGGIIVNQQGQVLLIQRARDPGKGKFGMPGGFVDPGESAERSLEREVLEEVGLQIDQVHYLNSFPNSYCYQEIASPVLDLFFTARAVYPSAIVPEDSEVSAWMWSDINQNILDNMAFHSNRLALEFYLNRKVD